MEIEGVQLRYEHGIWIGDVTSPRFGHMEAVLDGTPESPSGQHAEAFRGFLTNLDANIAKLRKQICCGFLYRPIRIAPNNENRVGVQFLNKLTGNQGRLILE